MFSREIKKVGRTPIKWHFDRPKNGATEMATSLGIKSKRVESNLALFKICAINLLKFLWKLRGYLFSFLLYHFLNVSGEKVSPIPGLERNIR
jgi:hypothetical protein